MPSLTLGKAAVPPALVPTRFPAIKSNSPESMMPGPLLPEITLPAPVPGVAVNPPIVVPEAPVSISMPVALAIATVPVKSVPMKLPATTKLAASS